MTAEQVSPHIPSAIAADIFVESYLRKRRQAEERSISAANADVRHSKRYDVPPRSSRVETPKSRTPLLTELVGDNYEQQAHLPLFISAILLGSTHRREGVPLSDPLDATAVRRCDYLAGTIADLQPNTLGFVVGQSELLFAQELVDNLEAKDSAAGPIAALARLALETAFMK
ncbi:MAG TPA: hypothetical protein VF733_04090 [Candidatus Saccharimonadales bacterium]